MFKCILLSLILSLLALQVVGQLQELSLVQYNSLKALYDSLNGSHWIGGCNWNWNFDNDRTQPCTMPWNGITCNQYQTSITHIQLGSCNMQGIIPTDIGNFVDLEYLSLQYNRKITGKIPSEIGLTSLKDIQLSFNKLSGSIPPQLYQLTNLKQLWLWDNQFDGSISTQICNLINLESFNIGNNKFKGKLPECIGSLLQLSQAFLYNNALTGKAFLFSILYSSF